MKIFIGGDHAGYALKASLIPYIVSLGHEVEDLGADVLDPEDDYPDFCKAVAERVTQTPGSLGIVIGGSGQGEAMVANRTAGVRAAVFYGEVPSRGVLDVSGTEAIGPFDIVRLSRMHNDANVLSLGSRFISVEEGQEAVRVFLSTSFSGDPRHVRRIEKF